jgi:excisionase family DNA binding protein
MQRKPSTPEAARPCLAPEKIRTLSVPATARSLGIGRTKLYELLNADDIRSIKIGSRRLVIASDVDAFVVRTLEDGVAR